MNKSIIWSLVTIAVLAGVGFWLIKSNQAEAPVVTNFEECVDAGYAVMESYPRQCKDEATGEMYVEDIAAGENPQQPVRNVGTGGCYIGGCSSQICSTDPNVVTTCEFREEYACYNGAKCERQASGQCGWTETAELNICLSAVVSPDVQLK